MTLAFFSLVVAEAEIHFPYLQSVRLQNISFGEWVSDEAISGPIISILCLPSVVRIAFESCVFQDSLQLNRLLDRCASGNGRKKMAIRLGISFTDKSMRCLANSQSASDVGKIEVQSLDLKQQSETQLVNWLAHPKCVVTLSRLEELTMKYSLLKLLLPALALPSLQHLAVCQDKGKLLTDLVSCN